MATALGAAQLYLAHVWKLHGLPKQIISHWGPQFVTKFTCELYQLLRSKLSATTAYHLQGYGQTEQINQELEQYLWIFVNEHQDDWDNLLALAKFQYNSHIPSATQQTHFMLEMGHHAWMGFEPQQAESWAETVNEFKNQIEKSLEEAKVALVKAKDNMTRYYNQHWIPVPEYHIGDQAFLDASDIRTTFPSLKIAHHYCHNLNSPDQGLSHVWRSLEQISRHWTQITFHQTWMHAKASQGNPDESPITIPVLIHGIMFHGDKIITQPHWEDQQLAKGLKAHHRDW